MAAPASISCVHASSLQRDARHQIAPRVSQSPTFHAESQAVALRHLKEGYASVFADTPAGMSLYEAISEESADDIAEPVG